MNRQDFKNLARIRQRETEALLASRNYSGAYYLCGYIVECGLKACIAKQTRRYDFPDKKMAFDSYTHNLSALLKAAQLEEARRKFEIIDNDFSISWGIVKDWSEESRYRLHTQAEAQELYDAVADGVHGVLQWIQTYW